MPKPDRYGVQCSSGSRNLNTFTAGGQHTYELFEHGSLRTLCYGNDAVTLQLICNQLNGICNQLDDKVIGSAALQLLEAIKPVLRLAEQVDGVAARMALNTIEVFERRMKS